MEQKLDPNTERFLFYNASSHSVSDVFVCFLLLFCVCVFFCLFFVVVLCVCVFFFFFFFILVLYVLKHELLCIDR